MKSSVKLTEKGVASLVGTDAFDLYLKAIARNMRTMMGQADVLATLMLDRKKHMCEYIAVVKAAE
jgi:hypothetical protein